MSGSLESMRWNACVHRLYSHQKEFLGHGVGTHVGFFCVFFFFFVPQLYLWGSLLLGEIFAYVTVF